jgi:FlaA1/EpsC-like NDP-sugar epimerase
VAVKQSEHATCAVFVAALTHSIHSGRWSFALLAQRRFPAAAVMTWRPVVGLESGQDVVVVIASLGLYIRTSSSSWRVMARMTLQHAKNKIAVVIVGRGSRGRHVRATAACG